MSRPNSPGTITPTYEWRNQTRTRRQTQTQTQTHTRTRTRTRTARARAHKSQITNHKSQITNHKSQITNHKSQLITHLGRRASAWSFRRPADRWRPLEVPACRYGGRRRRVRMSANRDRPSVRRPGTPCWTWRMGTDAPRRPYTRVASRWRGPTLLGTSAVRRRRPRLPAGARAPSRSHDRPARSGTRCPAPATCRRGRPCTGCATPSCQP